MKRIFRIAILLIIVSTAVITLTSGTSKEYNTTGERNLVDELYNQAVKQSDNLESIEDDIEKFYKKRDEALEKYNSFVSYNNRYYSDARSKSYPITGSAAKQKANDIISASEAKYNAMIADWRATIAALNVNEKELSDQHALLKIMITEPMINKYQTSSLPDNGKAKEANSDLLKVIERIKAITK